MALMDNDQKVLKQYFTPQTIKSLLATLEESSTAEDYTLQLGLTKLLLAIHENFRSKFEQHENVFRVILLGSPHKTTLVENALFIVMGLFRKALSLSLFFFFFFFFFFFLVRN